MEVGSLATLANFAYALLVWHHQQFLFGKNNKDYL
jgi:hypothetical protein